MISDSLFAEQEEQSWASLVCAGGAFGGLFPQARELQAVGSLASPIPAVWLQWVRVAAVGSKCGTNVLVSPTFYSLFSFYLSEIFFSQFVLAKEFISVVP